MDEPNGPLEDDLWRALVFDLDGTLVDLAVDWDEVAVDAVRTFTQAGVDADTEDLWALLDRATEVDLLDDIESVIAEHECAGARASTRLPLSDYVAGERRPVAVCSLNCEAACRIALETHGLDGAVDAVVGRDTVETRKPDPAPLLAAIEEMDVEPGDALFVGDSPRDETTAERAGTGFVYVSDLP